MGSILSICRQSDNVVEQNKAQEDKQQPQSATNAAATSNTPAPPALVSSSHNYYFDADLTTEEFEKLSTEEQDEIAESIYMSTREQQSTSLLLLDYPPANLPDPHRRNTIIMSSPTTLLAPLKQQRRRLMMKSVFLRKELEEPSFEKVGIRGYPGDLTPTELEAVLEFRRQIQQRASNNYQDMVRVYHGVESEPYALCRFLRARQYNVENVLQMLSEHVVDFSHAQSNEFYKNIETTLNCPLSTFLSQFPFIYSGVAKNGCPMAWFVAEHLSIDGIDCVTSFDTKLVCFVWYALTHGFIQQCELAQQQQEDKGGSSSRCELVLVVDLKGFSRSVVTKRTLSVFQNVAEATNSFPELLNRVVVVNAPSFFSIIWRIVQKFLDPRTLTKIQIHSDNSGQLGEIMDSSQLLSDLGGNGPSFHQVIGQDGQEQTTKLISLSSSNTVETMEFSLPSETDRAKVVVYTNSTVGSMVMVELQNNTTDSKAKPCKAKDAGSTGTANFDTRGPGTFTITVEKNESNKKSTEHFLVVVSPVTKAEDGDEKKE